jgi:hypothetical protein
MSLKVHSYAFVKECPNNGILEAIEGTITFIGDRRKGEGEHGEWSFQTIALTNPTGDKLDVKLKDREQMTNDWKGKTVRIASTVNSKGNRTGLYAITEEHDGKTYQKAKATATADIIDLAGAASGTQVRQAVEQNLSQGQASRPAPSQAPASRPAASPPASGETAELWKKTRQRIGKLAALQAVCYDAAVHNAHGIYERHGIAIMPGAVGMMGDKIFMEVVRKTDIDLLPLSPYAITPFQGTPLDQLIPAMRQQIGEGKAEMEFASAEKRSEIGRQHPSSVPAAPPVQPPPASTPAPAYDPHDPTPQPDDDHVPF